MVLTDEEIELIKANHIAYLGGGTLQHKVAKAQLKKVVEELGKYDLSDGESGYKLIPYYVWQALLGEVK